MKRFFIIIATTLCASVSLMAQNEMKEINEIKRSLNFLYATGTSAQSAEDASRNARDLLSLEIEQWLRENTTGDFSGYIAKSKQNVAEIKTQRGNLNRAFVYVKKSDILPYTKEEKVMLVTTDAQSAPQQTQVDTLALASSTPNSQQASSIQTDVAQQAISLPVFELTAVEKEMLSVSNLEAINKYIAGGSRDGIIGSYGKYDTNTRLFGKSYLYVFDRSQVLAVLRKDGNKIVNLSTGNDDAVANYGRCGVVWFQLKE